MLAALFLVIVCSGVRGETPLPMLLPGVQPTVEDTYLCKGVKLDNTSQFIVGFEPNATDSTVHHMMVHGCSVPGDEYSDWWDCNPMGASVHNSKSKPICAEGSKIIYAWARSAPAWNLPPGVGFKVGQGTDLRWLVVSVHYNNVRPFIAGAKDYSGVTVVIEPADSNKVTKAAGTYTFGTGGVLPAHQTTNMEAACMINETYYIFAYRTHTHHLGLLGAGYVKRSDSDWVGIGKTDPLKEELFFPVQGDPIIVNPGDVAAARCTMKNYLDHSVESGWLDSDEMCNYYFIYYVEGTEGPARDDDCFTGGPPDYYWALDPKVGPVPDWVDVDASSHTHVTLP